MANHQLLTRETHRDLRVHSEPHADRGDAVMATLVTPGEFRRVQSEFPIVFRLNQETGEFSALALFGFENGENLFLNDGDWEARYRPLSLSIQPFLIGGPAQEGGENQIHIDMDSPRISHSGEGTRVFDEDGGTTPYLDEIAGKLGELHVGYQASGDFFEALKRYELLEPFSLEVPLTDGSKHSLIGFHIVNEDKLRALDGEAVGELHGAGYLMPLFMHLASISKFSELIQRKDAKQADG